MKTSITIAASYRRFITKNQIAALLSAAVLMAGYQQARAGVVVSNLDPAEFGSIGYAEDLGQSVVTGGTPISLTSIEFAQSLGPTDGDSFAVYSRNADGTLGTELFDGFTLTFDSTSNITSATVNGSFSLQAETGYWFVLSNPDSTEWDYTSSPDYSARYGAALPEINTSYSYYEGQAFYFNLSQGAYSGPDLIQVNGQPLSVPEPSTAALIGLACSGALAFLRRQRSLAV